MFTWQSDPLVPPFIFHLANNASKQDDESDQHIIAKKMQVIALSMNKTMYA
jgi:hypothetical protein